MAHLAQMPEIRISKITAIIDTLSQLKESLAKQIPGDRTAAAPLAELFLAFIGDCAVPAIAKHLFIRQKAATAE